MNRGYVLLAVGLVAVVGTTIIAGKLERRTEVIPIDGATRVDIELSLSKGELIMEPGSISEAARIYVESDPHEVREFLEHGVRGETHYIVFESEDRREKISRDLENRWEVTLSDKYPTAAKLDIGACEAEIDLGGIPLTKLSLDIGAASGVMDFSKRNPERMRELEIDGGVSSLKVVRLGNANFEEFRFTGGVGSFDLDFSGDYLAESVAELEVGVASVDIRLPKGLPVRIEAEDDNFLSSVDIHDEDLIKRRNGIMESPEFASAKGRLVLRLEVGIGSVDIYRR